MGIMKINDLSLFLFGILEQVCSGSLTAIGRQTVTCAIPFLELISQSFK